MIALIGNHHLASMANAVKGSTAAFVAMNGFNAVTETLDEVDLFSFRVITAPKGSKKKGQDPDYSTHHQAMASPEAEEWHVAMVLRLTC